MAIRVFDMIEIPVSIGEVVDKITILEIKQRNISDNEKLMNVTLELQLLKERIEIVSIPEYLIADLKRVNEQLWDIENQIRLYEKNKDFGTAFVQLARSVYIRNDQRAEIKKQINLITNSKLIEEKSYA